MRSPLERPWSAMDMRSRVRGESIEEIADRKFYRRFDARGSRLRTVYSRTLENWGASYPAEQIFVGFIEDIHFNPEELLRSVYGFLGVDAAFQPPTPDKKVHSRSADTMPTRLAAHLARTYQDELARLEEVFGGYTSFWRYCGTRLSEGAFDDERIAYPLWDSSLWEEWRASEQGPAGTREVGLQSGPLSSLQAVR
ncbi:hypothetical protein AVDCRST_MAG82-223 [uncultured Rubrobacteraceae bacterium]|uniref:Sulfotransferase domain-containing protein n=1 Tax=uncultured Rubrobacteraceae bacterium TaxID=349277 RepID=A0A6J4P114_9ACTN|nr:hypothetical protein AVDCRST_MAG82-223 [uncultured Rubrobacteraceae bacterium]